jgi:NADH:ubiquinone oxidoreductase subunit 5 (subunit L)/multisubunit Na+/H+ antiporter MnhA subunit
MPIYSADLQPVHPVSFLWALPLLPAAGAAVLAVAGRALERRFSRAAVGAVAAATLGAAAGVALVASLGVLLPLGPGARGLLDARGLLVDAGVIRVGATLVLDPLSACLCSAVALAGVGVAVWMAAQSSRPDTEAEDDGPRPFVALSALVAGVLLLILAENFFLLVVGWEAATLGLYALASSRAAAAAAPPPERARAVSQALVIGRVGLAGLLAGVALLYWGLGAGMGSDGPGAGALSVIADVRGAGGAAIELRTKGDRPPTASIREVPVGPTLAFREIADQLALQDPVSRLPFAEALAARTFGGLPLLLLVCLGFLVAVLGRLAWLPLIGRAPADGPAMILARAVLFSIPTVVAGAYVIARFWSVFALSRAAAGTTVVLALLGAAGAWLVVVGVVVVVGAARFRARVVTSWFDTLFRELGVLPVNDFARAAWFLDRRLLALVAPIVAIQAALVMLIILLMR